MSSQPTETGSIDDLPPPEAALSPALLRAAEFSTVRKGFRQEEVTALLHAAADALERARTERDTFRIQLAARTRDEAALREELSSLGAEVERLRAQGPASAPAAAAAPARTE